MGASAPVDRVTPLALERGDRLMLQGIARTSVDGSVFDAVMQWDGLSGGASRPGGLFDAAAGGLEVAEQHADRHEYVLVSSGRPGIACVAAGVPSPCLAPRLGELAHERLRTGAELATTLSGGLEIDALPPPPVPSTALRDAVTFAVVLGVAAAVVTLTVAARRVANGPMGRVRAAARDALRATEGDATLQRLRAQVHALVARAAHLDVARRACSKKLRTIDRASLDRRTDECARSAIPEAAETLTWLKAERVEATRLEKDLAASVAGIARIESALRVVALRARAHRGVRARGERGDPVDTVAAELDLRDEGLLEADRFLAP